MASFPRLLFLHLFGWLVIIDFVGLYQACPFLRQTRDNDEKKVEVVDYREAALKYAHVSSSRSLAVSNAAEAIQSASADIAGLIAADEDLPAQFIRLTFHDCIHICDGCLDLSNPDNNGLGPAINLLQKVVDTYSGYLTRADIWALAGLVSTNVTQSFAFVLPQGGSRQLASSSASSIRKKPLPFKMNFYNRTTCPDRTGGPPRQAPSPHLTTAQVLAYFSSAFGFTTQDTVAIMGVHTLGKARKNNSGFDGEDGWVLLNHQLHNAYYKAMLGRLGQKVVNPGFKQERQNNTAAGLPFVDQYFWKHVVGAGLLIHGFMFNSDLALGVDLTGYLDPVTGLVTCALEGSKNKASLPICPQASTLALVNQYARDNDIWISHFREAFTKMTLNGYATPPCNEPVCPVLPL